MDADDGVGVAADDGVAANDGGAVVVDYVWRQHPLREFLEAELANYNIPLDVNDMGPTEVWETYCDREDTAHLFDGMVFGAAFKRRLQALRKQVGANLNRAAMDQMAFDIHRGNFPYQPFDAEGKRNWHGSEAEELLEEDLAEGLYPEMSPMELWQSRPQYQLFDKDVFRGHIHQSIQTAKYLHTLKMRDEEEQAEKHLQREKKKKKAEKKAANAAKAAAKEAAKAEKAAEKAAKEAAKEAAKAEKAAKKAASKRKMF